MPKHPYRTTLIPPEPPARAPHSARFWLVLLGALLLAVLRCGAPLERTVLVAVEGCREIHTNWIVEGLANLGAISNGRVRWRAALAGETPEVTVACTDVGLPGGAAAIWSSDAPNTVRFDPATVTDGFGTRSYTMHDLVHADAWLHGVHARINTHVCPRPGTPRSDCHPSIYDPNALMSPGTMDQPFMGSFSEASTGPIAQDLPQWSDQRYYDWLMGRE